MNLKQKLIHQKEHEKFTESSSNGNSVSASSQIKFQSISADNLSINSITAKPSGVYNASSYTSLNATNVVTEESVCLMDDPLKLNLQEKNDTSELWEGPVDYQTIVDSRVVYTGQEDEISTLESDSKNSIGSEQLKVMCVCVCMCVRSVCMRVCVCVCVC